MNVWLASPTSEKPIAARLFWVALVAVSGAAAEPALTPDVAVALALERPEFVAAVDAELDLARSDLLAARTWPNPELRMERVSADRPRSESDETSFLLSQEFQLGGRRAMQRRAAELGIAAAVADTAAERQRVRLEVLQRYYALVAAEREAGARRARLAALDELARVAARRAESGDLSGYESRRIQQSSALARSHLEEAAARQLAARQRLAGVIGIEGDRVAIPGDVDLLPLPGSLKAAPPANAELAALEARRSAATAAAAAAGRPALPVTVGIGQRRIEGAGSSDDALVLELALPLPLFDRNQASRMRADAESRRAENRYRMRLRDIEASVEAARTEAGLLTAAALRLRDEVVPQAEALTAIAGASFAEGEIDLTALLAALDAEMDAVNRSLDLQHRARMAWLELESLAQPGSFDHGESP